MNTKYSMRKKIIIFFLCLVIIPIIILYIVASNIFMRSTTENLKSIYATNIEEVGKQVNNYFDDALDVSMYPLIDQNLKAFLIVPSSSPDFMKIKKQASDILITMPYGFSSGIHDINLQTLEGETISTGFNCKIYESDKYQAQLKNGSPYWDFSQAQNENSYIYLTRLLRNPTNLSSDIGYIKLSISCSQIKSNILETRLDNQTSYFLITSDNEYIISIDENEYISNYESMPRYDELYNLAHSPLNSTEMNNKIISAYPIEKTDLIIYSISSPDVASIIRNTLLKNLAFLSLLIIIFTTILSFRFSRIITNPLNELGEHMNSISNENFSVRLPVKGNDEISILANHFNYMAEKLDLLYNEVYLGEIKLKQAQLDSLQAQINPHFLYNTLDTIYWMAKMGDTENVSIMVSKISRMMRLTLTPKTNDKIPLSQELEHLNCYIKIQELRYGKKVTFIQSCDDSLQDIYILSFLLQPLVENALIHGLSNSLQGIIKITIYEENDNIIYEVANNGEPIDVQQITILLNNATEGLKGFALKNLSERIKLKYGDKAEFSYYIENEFSIFKIIQPKETHI